ncbi:Uncharacterised protein [Mycobacterium tuberculosis]|nr:Uncharacterised protein [Mycobacterium tuberculosis]
MGVYFVRLWRIDRQNTYQERIFVSQYLDIHYSRQIFSKFFQPSHQLWLTIVYDFLPDHACRPFIRSGVVVAQIDTKCIILCLISISVFRSHLFIR